jgi:uncharacterized damage-inducible protein DinB
MNRELLNAYEDGGRKLQKAIDHLDRNDLMAMPVPGAWSIQQLVVHLADSDLVMSDRMKRVIAEDRPQLLAFDENRWVAGLHYELQSAQDAADLFALNRRVLAGVLRVLPDAAFARAGVHSERGEMTLETIVQLAVNHLEHHLKFLYEKREKLGKLLW